MFPKKRLRPEELACFTFKLKHDKLQDKSYWPIINEYRVNLVRVRTLLGSTELLLERTRPQCRNYEKYLDGEWNKVHRIGINLRSRLRKFEEFIRENVEKKLRAQSQIIDNTALNEKYDIDLAEMKNRLQAIRTFKMQLDQHNKAYAFYQQFLDQVVDNANIFKNPEHIVEKFEVLFYFKQILSEKQQRLYKETEEYSRRLEHIEQQRNLKNLEINNLLGVLRDRFVVASSRCKRVELILYRIKSRIEQLRLDVKLVTASISNTYKLTCSLRNVKPDAKSNLEEKITTIKRTMNVYNQIATQTRDANNNKTKKKQPKKEKKIN